MSHQLTFYITPPDTSLVETKVRALEPLAILCDRAFSAKPRLVDSLTFEEGGQPWWYLYLARLQDLDRILMREVPAQGYWSIDEEHSPVVQFDRSFFDQIFLGDGRIYWVDGYYEPDGSWTMKSAEFRAWAAKVRSTVKRCLKLHDGKLVGPDTLLWLANGGRFRDPFEEIRKLKSRTQH
jgi:hypothetical protein